MDNVVVSVVMSVYKNRGGLRKSIHSVLEQSFKNFEFIIIVDGSPSSTYTELVEISRSDDRIRIFKNPKNIGLSKSLNKGVSKAAGKYIARIDEGDIWKKSKLKKQVHFLDNNDNYVLIGSQYEARLENGKRIKSTSLPENNVDIKRWLKKGLTPFNHPSIVFRNCNINYNTSATTSQDFELYLRFYFIGKMKNLEDSLVYYIVQDNSISFRKEEEQFYNHLIMHKQFLNIIKEASNIEEFIAFGVDFNKGLMCENLRRSYMKLILKILQPLGQKSIFNKIFKNILIPDLSLYKIKRILN